VDRIRNATDLTGYTLMLHNQIEAAKVNQDLRTLTRNLNDLTQNNVDESTAIKVITFISAVYLPGSFVCVSSASPSTPSKITDSSKRRREKKRSVQGLADTICDSQNTEPLRHELFRL